MNARPLNRAELAAIKTRCLLRLGKRFERVVIRKPANRNFMQEWR